MITLLLARNVSINLQQILERLFQLVVIKEHLPAAFATYSATLSRKTVVDLHAPQTADVGTPRFGGFVGLLL